MISVTVVVQGAAGSITWWRWWTTAGLIVLLRGASSPASSLNKPQPLHWREKRPSYRFGCLCRWDDKTGEPVDSAGDKGVVRRDKATEAVVGKGMGERRFCLGVVAFGEGRRRVKGACCVRVIGEGGSVTSLG